MKSGHRGSWYATALVAWLAAGLSCGLQEHPQGSKDPGGIDDPGAGPIDPVVPPPTVEPAPTPAPVPTPPGAMPPASPLPTNPPPGPVPSPPVTTPTGPGVMINGTFVPKEKALVVIHWGHSNMFGQARSPSGLRSFFYDTQPGLWSYRGNNRFVLAREKTAPAPDGDSDSNNAGPGMAILRTLAAAAPANGGYRFISIGRGQGSATTSQYLKGGLYYSTFMNLAMQLKGRVTFAGVFVMMGITDRHMPMREQGGFADRMGRIVADIRADLGEPNLPVLHTDYEVTSTGSLSVNTDFARRIRPLMLSLPERINNLAIIPCDDIPLEDDHHFNMEGHKRWAERGVDIMRMRGWFPWAAGQVP